MKCYKKIMVLGIYLILVLSACGTSSNQTAKVNPEASDTEKTEGISSNPLDEHGTANSQEPADTQVPADVQEPADTQVPVDAQESAGAQNNTYFDLSKIETDTENPGFFYYDVSNSMLSDDELATASYHYKIPQLTKKSAIAGSINAQIMDCFQSKAASAMDEMTSSIDMYEQEKHNLPENSTSFNYSDDASYTITFDNGKYLSILINHYIYMGGAHGMPFRSVLTFDLDTGEQVSGDTLFAIDEDAFRKLRTEAFASLIKQDPSAYWEDALQIVENTTDFYTSGYYLSNDGVTFYYGPYDLAPYAAGFIEVTVPYDKIPLLKD